MYLSLQQLCTFESSVLAPACSFLALRTLPRSPCSPELPRTHSVTISVLQSETKSTCTEQLVLRNQFLRISTRGNLTEEIQTHIVITFLLRLSSCSGCSFSCCGRCIISCWCGSGERRRIRKVSFDLSISTYSPTK